MFLLFSMQRIRHLEKEDYVVGQPSVAFADLLLLYMMTFTYIVNVTKFEM